MYRNAASYAVGRVYDDAAQSSREAKPMVSMADFELALEEIEPAYGLAESRVRQRFLSHGLLDCGKSHMHALETIQGMVAQLQEPRSAGQTFQILLHGPSGSGKTGIAVHLALESGFDYIKIVEAKDLLRMQDSQKIGFIADLFTDARKAKSAFIVLDDIERIAELILTGSQVAFSHSMLHSLMTSMRAAPLDVANRLMVVATSSAGTLSAQVLRLAELFPTKFSIPLLTHREAVCVAKARGLYRLEKGDFELPKSFRISFRNLLSAVHMARFRADSSSFDDFEKPILLNQVEFEEALRFWQTDDREFFESPEGTAGPGQVANHTGQW